VPYPTRIELTDVHGFFFEPIAFDFYAILIAARNLGFFDSAKIVNSCEVTMITDRCCRLLPIDFRLMQRRNDRNFLRLKLRIWLQNGGFVTIHRHDSDLAMLKYEKCPSENGSELHNNRLGNIGILLSLPIYPLR
jgi:hypothetical protein